MVQKFNKGKFYKRMIPQIKKIYGLYKLFNSIKHKLFMDLVKACVN